MTPHETLRLRSLTKTRTYFLFLSFVIFLSLNNLFPCICEQVCNSLKTYSKGEGKNKKEDLAELVRRKKKEKEGTLFSFMYFSFSFLCNFPLPQHFVSRICKQVCNSLKIDSKGKGRTERKI